MKKKTALLGLLVFLLAALTSCELFQGVNVQWSIDSMTPGTPLTTVAYTAYNMGKVDLTGVNLQVGVDVYKNGTYPAFVWTSDFDLRQGQVYHGVVSVVTPTSPLGGATVIGVDMDKTDH